MPSGRGPNAVLRRLVAFLLPLNIVAAGNSLVVGTNSSNPWTNQFQAQLNAGGFTDYSLESEGHGGYCTSNAGSIQATHFTDPPGNTSFSLQALIPSDVDSNYDEGRTNVLLFQEVINDIYYGQTGAQAYANVIAYMQTLARRWQKQILLMPTPRQNVGTKGPGVTSAGTSPPLVTASSSPVGIYDEFDFVVAGGLGTAAFNWYRNGVLMQSNVVAEASLVLGGITYGFAAGSYTAGGYPTANQYFNTAGFEAERQDFIARTAVDPTFQGTIDAVVYLDRDPRLADPTNLYYYASDQVHFNYLGDAVCSSLTLTVMREVFGIAYSPAHEPYPNPVNDTSIPGKQLNDGGTQALDGQGVKQLLHLLAWDSSEYLQNSDPSQPIFVANGIGGRPSVSVTPSQNMVSNATHTGYNIYSKVMVLEVTAGGLFSQLTGAEADVRFYADDLSGEGLTIYDFDDTTAVGSVRSAASGVVIDGQPHVLAPSCNGTDATHLLRKDGVLVATSVVGGHNQDPPSAAVTNTLYFNGSSGGMTGKVSFVFESPVELLESEFERLTSYCLQRFGIAA